MNGERIAFENWLGIKPCGAAHDLAWAAWKARASLPTQPAAQATPPQQAAGEPVGELVAALPDGISFHVRWLAHSGPALKVGDRIYTHPAPGVPEGFVLVPVEPTDEMVMAGALAHQRSPCHDFIGPIGDAWVAMLAAAQAKGGER